MSGLKNIPFDADVALNHIKKRMLARMKTAEHLALLERNRAQARELPAPRTEALRKWLTGLADIDEEGTITFQTTIKKWLFEKGD